MKNLLRRISSGGRCRAFLVPLVSLCLFCGAAQAQNIKVTGKVTDGETGEVVVGATIVIPGTNRGVTSSANGFYSIDAPKDGKLTLSMVGYDPQTVDINSRAVINFTLNSSATEIEAVVMIGYGSVAKSSLTSAISTVSEKDILKTPVNSIEQALQGNAAGVLVINTSAEPGGEVTMRIRGGSSVSGGNEPLVVIDGFPSDNAALQLLNPADVKSMEVLKDASATAIYGSRGANGIIMVTTKSGDSPKAKVGVNVSLGVNVPRRKIPMMSGEQWSEYDNFGRMVWGVNSVRTLRPDTMATANFQDMLVNDVAYRSEYNINVSGQSKEKDIKYYIAAGYLDEDGILHNSSASRMSYRSKLDINLSKKVTFQLTSSASRKEQQKIGGGGTGAILRTLMMNPTTSMVGRTFVGGVFFDEETGEPLSAQSEISRAMNGNVWNKEFNATIGGQLAWKIRKDLTFTTRGQYSYTDKRAYSYMPRSIFFKTSDIDKNNKATRGADQSIKWVNENFFNYNPKFSNRKHDLALTLGQSWERSRTEGFALTVRRFDTDYYMWNNLASAAYYDAPSTNSPTPNSLLSVFFRAMYNYDKRFLTSWSIRTDGSSRFGEDRKFGYFPSGSVAWVMTNEKFMKDRAKWLSSFKLRASYGITGNDDIGSMQSISRLSASKVVIDQNPYTGNMNYSLGNPNLQWETERQLDLGFNMGLFRERITLAFDVYQKTTFNQLYSYRVPLTTGYSSIMANIGESDNRGLEVEITSRNIISKTRTGFNWTTSLNLGYNKNKVTDLGGNDNVVLYYLGDNVNQNITFLKIGQPQAVFMGYKTSIYKNWEEVYADDAVWVEDPLVIKTVPGMRRYYDLNGDGVIDDDDKVILGQGQPKMMGGFTNTFSYKNFDLTIFFNGAWGNSVVNTNVTKLKRDKAGSDNQMRYMFDVWRPINPSAGDQGYKGGKNPIPTSNSHSTSTARDYMANLTDDWVEDASYLRLKSISLTYTLPEKISRKFGVSRMALSATGVNLLTFTNYTGYDPEMSSSQGSSSSRLGIDLSSYPPTKGVNFKLDLTF